MLNEVTLTIKLQISRASKKAMQSLLSREEQPKLDFMSRECEYIGHFLA
jgi:hypothetical protein